MIMKTQLTSHFTTLLFVAICLQLFSCQTDNEDSLESQNTSTGNQITSKLVSADQIPQIIQFINTQSSKDLSFTLKPSINSNRLNENLIIGTLDTEEIRQVTNSADKSNYTFTMDKENSTSEFSIINYVLKETQSGYYSYFLEFIPDTNWLKTSPNVNDLTLFTGVIKVYNRYGMYVGENVFTGGVKTSQNLRTNCPNDNDDTTTGGDGTPGNNDSSDSDSNSDSSDSSDGTNGTNIDIEITCGCAPGHDGGNENDSCNCTDTDIIITINFADQNDETVIKTPLRNPCPPTDENCNSQNDCEFGFDASCNCLENPDNENSSDGIVIDLSIIAALQAQADPNDSYIFDPNLNPNEALHFNNVDEFTEFRKGWEFISDQPIIETQEGNHITAVRLRRNALLTMNFDLFVNQILNDPINNQEYEFIEVTSEISGTTFAHSWEQVAIEHVIIGNEIIVTVYGNLNFNLFLESIGTIYTDVIILELHINIDTGEPISAFIIEE